MKKWENFSDEEKIIILKKSNNYSQAAKNFGYKNCDSALKKDIKMLLEKFNLPQYKEKHEDLTGKIFGYLTVLKFNGSKNGKRTWLCQCKCGNKITVTTEKLNSQHTQSCGCYNKERIAETHIKDITGKRFGKLVVLKQSNIKKNRCIYWDCLCDCGNKVCIRGSSLRNGHTQSCGCLESFKGEEIIKSILDKNKYNYQIQYTFSDLIGDKTLLRFDFAIIQNNKVKCLIEYQGEQHYFPIDFFGGEEKFKKQQTYDNKKREYCKLRKIPLLEFSYLEKDKMSEEYILEKIEVVMK